MNCLNTYALVDYTEKEPAKNSSRKDRSGASTSTSSSIDKKLSPLSEKFSSNLTMQFQSLKLQSDADQKIQKMIFNGRLETQFGIFLDASFWTGSGVGFENQELNQSQNGNPEFRLGFNFIKIGGGHDMATMDFYFGTMLKSNSPIASSRSDQMFGVELSKRFFDFGFGGGYELRNTGKPESSYDYELGNIQKLFVSSGWIATEDIKFLLDFNSIVINPGKDGHKLSEKVSYSTLAPKLVLGIIPKIELTLGAEFLVKRPQTTVDLFPIKTLNNSPYGTNLIGGLGFIF